MVAGEPKLGTGRAIVRRPGLPGGRAALGGLLITVAALSVFLAYQRAEQGPTTRVVVATQEIRVGAVIEADDVQVVLAELPAGTGPTTFSTAAEVVGHVALGPIAAGEIVQAGAITADRSAAGANEVAITLPRAQIAVGRLKAGDRVDIFVTYDERTSSVVREATVVLIGTDRDRSLTSDRELSIVVAVPSGDAVAALVHALRTGEVTVVRSTFASSGSSEPLVYEPATYEPTVEKPANAGRQP